MKLNDLIEREKRKFHYGGWIQYKGNLDGESNVDLIAKDIKAFARTIAKETIKEIVPEKYEGIEKPDCGDPACPCGGYEYTEEESGFNGCIDEIKEQANKWLEEK